MIIDGLKGKLIVDPDEEELAYYTDRKYQFENYHASIMRGCLLPAETIDGYRINVLANIELFEEVTSVLDNGGEGVGALPHRILLHEPPQVPGRGGTF